MLETMRRRKKSKFNSNNSLLKAPPSELLQKHPVLIKIANIKYENSENPRVGHTETEIRTCAASIRVFNGVRHPITVEVLKATGDLETTTFKLLEGFKRVEAAKLAEHEYILAYITNDSELRRKYISFAMNDESSTVDPISRGRSLKARYEYIKSLGSFKENLKKRNEERRANDEKPLNEHSYALEIIGEDRGISEPYLRKLLNFAEIGQDVGLLLKECGISNHTFLLKIAKHFTEFRKGKGRFKSEEEVEKHCIEMVIRYAEDKNPVGQKQAEIVKESNNNKERISSISQKPIFGIQNGKIYARCNFTDLIENEEELLKIEKGLEKVKKALREKRRELTGK